MIDVKGHTAQVSFDGQHVTITRKGLSAHASTDTGETRLHVSQISAVRWKPAGLMLSGSIRFAVPGGDEHSVEFTRGQMSEFERLRAAIDGAVSRQRALEGSTDDSPVDDELAKLASLRDSGVISAADFETVKAKLLGTR